MVSWVPRSGWVCIVPTLYTGVHKYLGSSRSTSASFTVLYVTDIFGDQVDADGLKIHVVMTFNLVLLRQTYTFGSRTDERLNHL